MADFIFLGSKITADGDYSHKIKRHLFFGRKAMENLDSKLKSRDITLLTKVHRVKAMVFASSCVWMWELHHKKSWAWKNWCFWTVPLKKTLKSPLDYMEMKPVNPKRKARMKLAQSCQTLWPHGLYSPWNSPGRILEWVAFPFSRGSSQPRDWT